MDILFALPLNTQHTNIPMMCCCSMFGVFFSHRNIMLAVGRDRSISKRVWSFAISIRILVLWLFNFSQFWIWDWLLCDTHEQQANGKNPLFCNGLEAKQHKWTIIMLFIKHFVLWIAFLVNLFKFYFTSCGTFVVVVVAVTLFNCMFVSIEWWVNSQWNGSKCRWFLVSNERRFIEWINCCSLVFCLRKRTPPSENTWNFESICKLEDDLFKWITSKCHEYFK